MIRVAIVTVSDSVAGGTRNDASGPALAEICLSQGWSTTGRHLVEDDAAQIADLLRRLAASGANDLIVTTGGTGITARDVTPEATRTVIGKELPGLADLMRSEGLKHTRRAVLSRSVVGTAGECLIVNLPGSPAGARQSLNAILDLVPHIVELLKGHTRHEDAAKRGGEA